MIKYRTHSCVPDPYDLCELLNRFAADQGPRNQPSKAEAAILLHEFQRMVAQILAKLEFRSEVAGAADGESCVGLMESYSYASAVAGRTRASASECGAGRSMHDAAEWTQPPAPAFDELGSPTQVRLS